ncbi:hypothetical protein BVRB_9g203620 [Beta vulgaris subsp. vulgaris]|nr:hypothetical protein BVRB_9g203620 [Beta vulgaris subsp. vulgaris]
MLRLTSESVLELINGTNAVIWATNLTRALKNPVAELLDSGNLIIKAKDNNEEEFDGILWQSFDYPCDIQLPGMKLGKDLVRGLDRYLTSWRNSDDPSLGSYTYRLDYHGYPQPVLMKGVVEQYRNGPWNGIRFSGNPSLKHNPFFTFKFVMNSKAMYYVYDLLNSSVISHRLLNPYGTMQRLVWSDHVQGWIYPKNGQDLYVKLNASELGKRKRRIWIMLSSIFVAITVLVLTTTLFLWKKMRFWRKGKSRESYIVSDRENAEPELPLFDISLIAQATNNFSDENRIGEGGFGPVYKRIHVSRICNRRALFSKIRRV